MTTSVVDPRPCKTCGEPANYIGTSATGTAFACPACASTSWYYEDEPEPYRGPACSHPHNLPYNDECAVWWLRGGPRWREAHTNRPDVSLLLAGHTAAALDKLAP